MTWPKWVEKALRFIRASTGTDWPGRAGQAQDLLEQVPVEPLKVVRFTPRSRVTSRVTPHVTGVDTTGLAFPKVAPGLSQSERRALRNDRVWELRGKVLSRARKLFGGYCEWCFVGEACEAHHTLGGSDKVTLEHESNMAAVCADCHHRTEESPAWDREQSLRWARRLAGDRRLTDAERAGFARTVAELEARTVLAAAQAVPLQRKEGDLGR